MGLKRFDAVKYRTSTVQHYTPYRRRLTSRIGEAYNISPMFYFYSSNVTGWRCD
jgi:hypothetical protein